MIWLVLAAVVVYGGSIALGALVAGSAGARACARQGVFGFVTIARAKS